MISNLIKLAVLVGIVVIAGIVYWTVSRSPAGNTTTPPSFSQKEQGGQVVVNLAQLNNSGELGTAILEEKGGYAVVTLNVNGGKNGVEQPAHLHTDTCPGLGAVKYQLKNVVDGTSTTTLNVSLVQLKQDLPLALNIHESTDNYKDYVACGEVSIP